MGSGQVEAVFGQAIGPNQGGIGGNGIGHIAQYGEWFVIDDDGISAIFGSRFGFGNHHHNGVTTEQYFVMGQHGA